MQGLICSRKPGYIEHTVKYLVFLKLFLVDIVKANADMHELEVDWCN